MEFASLIRAAMDTTETVTYFTDRAHVAERGCFIRYRADLVLPFGSRGVPLYTVALVASVKPPPPTTGPRKMTRANARFRGGRGSQRYQSGWIVWVAYIR